MSALADDNARLAEILRHALERAGKVEIAGLGVFERGPRGRISFRPSNRARIFIAYATEDYAAALRLYSALRKHGYQPWLDRKDLLPGQNWPRRIEDSIADADFFIPCFSSHSVRKRGGFQTEVRHALECGRRMPVDDVFIVPVRLDRCKVPARIQAETQYVDLFPDFHAGVERVIRTLVSRRREAA